MDGYCLKVVNRSAEFRTRQSISLSLAPKGDRVGFVSDLAILSQSVPPDAGAMGALWLNHVMSQRI